MLSGAERKRIRGLARRRVRDREGLFLAEGVRGVEELLQAGIVPSLVVVSSSLEDTDRGARLLERLEARPAGVRRIPDGELKELADTATTQGVLVVAPIPRSELAGVNVSGPSVVLALDGVQDPGNLGTLARSATAFGCDALVCLPGTVDPWNPKAVRASAGALFRLPVVQDTVQALRGWADRHGHQVLGADAAGAPVREARSSRTVLVVGNEGGGLGEEARERCERLVAVPMRGETESLNAAVAGAILLYELTREMG